MTGFDFQRIYEEARRRFMADMTNPVDMDETVAKVAFEHGTRALSPSPDRLREALEDIAEHPGPNADDAAWYRVETARAALATPNAQGTEND